MGDFITRWWPVIATIAILPIAKAIAYAIAEIGQNVLDRRIPDDLPLTAGEWLDRAIHRLGYGAWLKVIVSRNRTSWYSPEDLVIHLDADTYYKRDPLYWAVAAHELGHARLALHHPVAHGLMIAIRVMDMVLVRVGIGLAIGNVLVAIPLVTDVAFACLVVGLVLHAVQVIGEIYASSFAIAALRRSGVGPNRMRAVAASLTLACSTYICELAACAAMLMRWDLVDRAIGGGWTPTGGPTALGYLVAAIASVWFVRATYWRLRGVAKLATEQLAANIAIVWIMWDCGHPLLAGFAVVPLGRLIAPLALIPGEIVGSALMRLVRGLIGAEVTPQLVDDKKRGREAIKAGDTAYASILKPATDRINRYQRYIELIDLLVLPLVIAFWLGL